MWGDSSGFVGTLDIGSDTIRSQKVHHGPISALDIATLPSPPALSTSPFPPTPPTPPGSGGIPNGNSMHIPNEKSGDKDMMSSIAAVGSGDSSVSILRVDDLSMLEPPMDVGMHVTSLAFSPNGSLLAIGGLGKETLILETSGWNVLERIPTPFAAWVTSLTFIRSSVPGIEGKDVLAIGYSPGRVQWYALQPTAKIGTTNLSAWANDMLGKETGEFLITGGMDGNITIIPFSNMTERRIITNDHPILSLDRAVPGYDIASSDSNGILHFWTFEEAVRIEEPKIVEPEPDTGLEPDVGIDGEERELSDGLKIGLMLISTILLIVALVSYLVGKGDPHLTSIPVARLIGDPSRKPTGDVPVQMENMGEGKELGTGKERQVKETKVINIFIRDSVINRSNLTLDGEEGPLNDEEGRLDGKEGPLDDEEGPLDETEDGTDTGSSEEYHV